MSSARALPVIRSLCVLAATAAILVTACSGTGTGQTLVNGAHAQSAPGGVTSAATSKQSMENKHNDTALQTLWSDHIWQCIPASDLKGLTPGAVSKAYEASNWQPLFINSRFELNSNARRLLARLRSIESDAIDPGPFELDRLSRMLKNLDTCRSALGAVDPQFEDNRAQSFFAPNPAPPAVSAPPSNGPSMPAAADRDRIAENYRKCFRAASQADCLLTTDFFRLAKEMDPYSPVENGLKALLGKTPLSSYFTELEPKGYGYQALRSAYRKYTLLAERGGQLYVSLRSKVHPGWSGKQIRLLQERLRQEGFYSGEATGVYDSETQLAVKQFQSAHMINPDGAPGRKTLEWLNMPFKQKAALVAFSLKAVRNSPSRQYDRFIRVNIPQFMLDYYNGGQVLKADRVVVGRASGKRVNRQGRIVGENQTPTIVSQIDEIIFNPRWYVDGRIRLELNAHVKTNPEWFAQHGYVKMESKYAFGQHRLFQKSGPKNALGRVKFDFPNPFTVYLHDTPEKYLFARPRRDFSHGCIRVDHALELAQTLLDDDANPYVEKVHSVLEGDRQTFVKLSRPVPITVEYIPVVSGADGQVIFAGDPYGVVAESSNLAQNGNRANAQR